MTNINPVAHVEIPVTDLDRAMRFYEAVFRVSFTDIVELHGCRMAHFPFEEGMEGASVALAEGDVYVPTLNGAVVYFSVDDIDAAIARAEACGSEVLFPKSSVSGGAFVAEIRDSEGNRIAFQSVTTGT